jgi:drug/metabolite transporter (DMT)-like permease
MSSLPVSRAHTYRILLAFTCLYLFWGGTYTAARFGVVEMPAPVLAGTRLAVAGTLILAFCALSGKRLMSSAWEMRRIFVLGVLLLFFGNVALVWAQFYLPSGLCALLVAIVPVYIALIELSLPHGERLRLPGQIGLVMGFIGLGILAWPSAHRGLHGDWHQIAAIVVLLLGAFSFACGSIWSRLSNLTLDPIVCAGWEMLSASACNMVLATVVRDWHVAHWNHTSIAAISYLVVFGSLIGFSCYSWLLSNVPVTKLATYAYVNPVIAVILGALILRERLQGNEWIGMVIILTAVVLVTSSKLQRGHGAPKDPRTDIDALTSQM